MVELTLTLLIFLFPLAYSPGPGNMFFAATGARFGIAATMPANIGYHIATWVVTFFIGIGIGVAARGLGALQYAGAAYVFYLAWRLWRAPAAGDIQPRPAGFMDGAILLLLNPKAYLIIAAMFAQFLPPRAPIEIGRVLWITTVFTLNNLVAFLLWTYAGDKLLRRFRRPAYARTLNRSFALLLAAVAGWLLI